jgi:hypothetical protein
MSKGISKQQRRILDLVSIPGKPEGLTRGVLQAQLWPDLFCKDYRFTVQSEVVVKDKAKCRVILSRAVGSLIKRGLLTESGFGHLPADEVHIRGLALPYALQHNGTQAQPNGGYDTGRFLTAVHVANTPLSEPSRIGTSCADAEIAQDEKEIVSPSPEPQEPSAQRMVSEGASLSAFVLALRAKQAILQISISDPNAIAAVESIETLLMQKKAVLFNQDQDKSFAAKKNRP